MHPHLTKPGDESFALSEGQIKKGRSPKTLCIFRETTLFHGFEMSSARLYRLLETSESLTTINRANTKRRTTTATNGTVVVVDTQHRRHRCYYLGVVMPPRRSVRLRPWNRNNTTRNDAKQEYNRLRMS